MESLKNIYLTSSIPLIAVKDLFPRGIEITEVYHGEYRPLNVGPKAILACRTEEISLKDIDRLILKNADKNNLEFADRFDPAVSIHLQLMRLHHVLGDSHIYRKWISVDILILLSRK